MSASVFRGVCFVISVFRVFFSFQIFSVQKVLALGSPQLEGSENCGIGSFGHCLSRTADGTDIPSVLIQHCGMGHPLPGKSQKAAFKSKNWRIKMWGIFKKVSENPSNFRQDIFKIFTFLLFSDCSQQARCHGSRWIG